MLSGRPLRVIQETDIVIRSQMPLWKLHLGLEFNGKLSSSLDVLDWVLVLLMSSQRGESNKLFDF